MLVSAFVFFFFLILRLVFHLLVFIFALFQRVWRGGYSRYYHAFAAAGKLSSLTQGWERSLIHDVGGLLATTTTAALLNKRILHEFHLS